MGSDSSSKGLDQNQLAITPSPPGIQQKNEHKHIQVQQLKSNTEENFLTASNIPQQQQHEPPKRILPGSIAGKKTWKRSNSKAERINRANQETNMEEESSKKRGWAPSEDMEDCGNWMRTEIRNGKNTYIWDTHWIPNRVDRTVELLPGIDRGISRVCDLLSEDGYHWDEAKPISVHQK
ncbi:phosphoribulokinase / Uridine kinase family [Striga asiatica]|uniref:Phosphoribulokinase / Uridine kinase family n=1 Tax=Striga asiatica TaxID=4170 RepID=A0A5A7QH01_STRAF|nr:phosphoribulokinase / Uridine kinase family [Striga asiatica]